MTCTHDVIVLGRGLAGAVLSEVLAQRGLKVMVFDAEQNGRASHVATGLVNPIVLRRTVPSWRASEMKAIAGAFYRELEQRYERRMWHPMPLIEVFPTAQEAGIWPLRMKDPELARMIEAGPSADPAAEDLPMPYGCGIVPRCAWLDVQALLEVHAARWTAAGGFERRHVEAQDINVTEEGVRIGDRSAPVLIRCTGAFDKVPGLVPVRGEGLTVHIPGLRLKSVLHRGVFIVPIGEERFRVGATFAWTDVWNGSTEEGRHWLTDRLERAVARPFEVEEHWSGVRPASGDRRPVLGQLREREYVLNGLGSRGVLLAPWCAQHLTAHLFEGEPLDPEVDATRFA